MQYAAAGKLKQADEERIVQKMKLKPDMVIGWLHSPTPEHISPDLLEKARCHNWGSLPNLQSLKEQDRIKEPFYALLMKWLNLPTKEAVDTWIVKGFEEIEVTKEDEVKIQELGKDPTIYRKILGSIAPSIYGYEEVKEAMALQLFAGLPKELPDGLRIRGDIHVLLVGDPGVAKSQCLRYARKLAQIGRAHV